MKTVIHLAAAAAFGWLAAATYHAKPAKPRIEPFQEKPVTINYLEWWAPMPPQHTKEPLRASL